MLELLVLEESSRHNRPGRHQQIALNYYNYFFFCLADILRQASFIDVILYGFSMSGTLHSDVDADNYVMSYDIPAH